jgi:hypothetical protein
MHKHKGFLAFLFSTINHEVFYFFLTFLFYSEVLHFYPHTHIYIYIQISTSSSQLFYISVPRATPSKVFIIFPFHPFTYEGFHTFFRQTELTPLSISRSTQSL